jgi:Tol biopolymer transport system component
VLGLLSVLGAAPIKIVRSEQISGFVFNSAFGDTVQVFEWNPGNNRVTQLTFGPMSFGHPSPTPDRSKIAFVRDVDGGRDVYVFNLATGRASQLTNDPGRDDLPKFSPDGNAVSYSSRRNGLWQVYVYDLQSRRETRVTDGQFNELESAWHPNGQRLVFSSDRSAEPGGQDIWSCRLDGTDLRQLTTSSGQETGAAYSPDGARIVFTAHWDFKWDVFVKDLRTGWVTRIADSLATDTEAVFLSNDVVAFSTFRSGRPQIAIVDVRDPKGLPEVLVSGHWPQD